MTPSRSKYFGSPCHVRWLSTSGIGIPFDAADQVLLRVAREGARGSNLTAVVCPVQQRLPLPAATRKIASAAVFADRGDGSCGCIQPLRRHTASGCDALTPK